MEKITYYSEELLEEMRIRINNLDVGLKRFSDLITPIYSKGRGASGIPGRYGLPLPFSKMDQDMNEICHDLHLLETYLDNMESWLDKDLLKKLSEKPENE